MHLMHTQTETGVPPHLYAALQITLIQLSLTQNKPDAKAAAAASDPKQVARENMLKLKLDYCESVPKKM